MQGGAHPALRPAPSPLPLQMKWGPRKSLAPQVTAGFGPEPGHSAAVPLAARLTCFYLPPWSPSVAVSEKLPFSVLFAIFASIGICQQLTYISGLWMRTLVFVFSTWSLWTISTLKEKRMRIEECKGDPSSSCAPPPSTHPPHTQFILLSVQWLVHMWIHPVWWLFQGNQ